MTFVLLKGQLREGHWNGWVLKIDTFWAMKMATAPLPPPPPITNQYLHSCSKTHVHKISKEPVFYMALGLNFNWGKSISRTIERGRPEK